jgi:riboflavin synthase
VDARGEVVLRQPEGDALLLRIRTPQPLLRYIVEKGCIAVDGVSLTVVGVQEESFTVSLVEYTQRVTTLGRLQPGASVNLEVDILAKYVERLLAGYPGASAR